MNWWVIIFILAGCSVNPIFFPSSADKKTSGASIPETKINPGPTLSNSSFVDETELWGLGNVAASNFFIIDFNQDGYSDIVYLPEYFSQPKFLIFSPKEKIFTPLDYDPFMGKVKAHFLLFYHFDQDEIIDVVVGVLNQKSEIRKVPLQLYLGVKKEGKLYFELSKDAINLPAGPHATIIPIDYDLDGDLDLFVGNWFDQTKQPPLPVPDILLENQSGKFKIVSEILSGEWKTDTGGMNYVSARPTYAGSACDINQDGFPDILTSSTNGHGNKLWINSIQIRNNTRYFVDQSITSGFAADPEGLLTAKGGGRTFSVVCADYNHDSIMDVFMGEVYHNYDPDSVDRSSILSGSTRKFDPSFIRTEYELDSNELSWHQADRRGIWFDYNLDGYSDLLIDNSGYPPHTRMVLFAQDSDHSFSNIAKEVGVDLVNPLSTVILDVNQDGRPDILTAQSDLRDSNLTKRVYLLINKHPAIGKPLQLHLRGSKSNYAGIGATVIVKLSKGEKLYQRIYNVEYSQGGLPPQNEQGLKLAILPEEKLRSIVVRWPYSKNSRAKAYDMEKTYKIEGELGPEYTLCEAGYFLPGRQRCGR